MIDVRRYLASVRAVARHHSGPTGRRVLAGVLIGYPLAEALIRSARALDHLVAPGQRTQAVRAPVFVVGHPRSGTTWLHRLLALDADRFTTPRAWQVVVPAVSLYRLARAANRHVDLQRLESWSERALFGAIVDHHPTTWRAPEEDSWLFLHTWSTPTLEFLTAAPALTRALWIADALPAQENERRMRWYRRSVQRHLFATAPDATLLSKNPHFAGWIRSLARAFPSARFILLTRDPAEAITSRLRLVTTTWQAAQPMLRRDDPRMREMFDASCALYRHAEACWTELSPDRKHRVRYDDLIRDPVGEVRAIRDHFGWGLGGDLQRATEEQARLARRRLPSSPVRLRRFGLREADLARALGDLSSLWEHLGRRPPSPRPWNPV
ncbi:MAG: sulfotransferase [Deltaproteobacteria bacterium]|nr:sulfotransferase [Deltaproteobacteria bacterium]